MFSGISKKVIFFSFLFINFLQLSKSAELAKINKNINSQNKITTENFNEDSLPSSSNFSDDNISYVNLLQKNFDSFLVAKLKSNKS